MLLDSTIKLKSHTEESFPPPQPVKAKVFMPDATWIEGLAESAVSELKAGDSIQFERFGFVRFDQKNKKGEYEFWFTHK